MYILGRDDTQVVCLGGMMILGYGCTIPWLNDRMVLYLDRLICLSGGL